MPSIWLEDRNNSLTLQLDPQSIKLTTTKGTLEPKVTIDRRRNCLIKLGKVGESQITGSFTVIPKGDIADTYVDVDWETKDITNPGTITCDNSNGMITISFTVNVGSWSRRICSLVLEATTCYHYDNVDYYVPDRFEKTDRITVQLAFGANVDEQIRKARLLCNEGELKLALLELDRAAELDHQNIYVLRDRADIHLALGNPQLAVTDLTLLLNVVSDDGFNLLRAKSQRAKAFVLLGDYNSALKDFTSILDSPPGLYEYFDHLVGNSVLISYGATTELLTGVIDKKGLDYDNPTEREHSLDCLLPDQYQWGYLETQVEIYFNRALCYFDDGAFDLVIADLNRVLEIGAVNPCDPTNTYLHYLRAKAYEALGLVGRAADDDRRYRELVIEHIADGNFAGTAQGSNEHEGVSEALYAKAWGEYQAYLRSR